MRDPWDEEHVWGPEDHEKARRILAALARPPQGWAVTATPADTNALADSYRNPRRDP